MFCNQCGQPIAAQPHCSYCGAPVGFTGVPPLPASRVTRHVHLLGILWTAYAVYLLLAWLLFMPFLRMAFSGDHWMSGGSDNWMFMPFHPGGWLLHFITFVVFVRAILSLAVGIALLTRKPWGRIYAIVIAFLTLIKPFLGTILAIYTLWVLLSRDADRDYTQQTLLDGPRV